jgi:hypothetical protein
MQMQKQFNDKVMTPEAYKAQKNSQRAGKRGRKKRKKK